MGRERIGGIRTAALAVIGALAACSWCSAAEVDRLPVSVRDAIQLVDPAVVGEPIGRGALGLSEVGPGSLDAARQALIAALLADRATTVERWRDELADGTYTLTDICRGWVRFTREHPLDAQTHGSSSALWRAAAETFPATDRDPAKLPLDDALYLGEVQLWANDLDGAEATFTALLARLPQSRTTGRTSRGLLAYRIAQCWEYRMDLDKAREWYLKCADWGAPEMTGGYDVRGEGLVEAARMCRRLGRDEEAQGYYRKAMDECGQWGQTVAAVDLWGLLDAAGKHSEARALVERVADSRQLAPNEGVILQFLRGKSCWDEAQTDSSREALNAAMAAYESIPYAARVSVQWFADRARNLLALMDRWATLPIQVSPASVRLNGVRGQTSAPQIVAVETERPVALTLTAQPPCLELVAAGESLGEGVVSRRYAVRLSSSAPTGVVSGVLAISSDALPGTVVRVPVEGVVVADIVCVPSLAYFGLAKPGEGAKCVLRLHSRTGTPFVIREVEADEPGIRVAQPVRVGPAEWTLTVSLVAADPGIIDGKAVVRTDMPDAETIEIPVYAQVMGP